MLLGVDHVVIAVGDLAAATRDYAALGFSVAPGGRHAAGTHNALIALAAGAYIELIAFYEPLSTAGGRCSGAAAGSWTTACRPTTSPPTRGPSGAPGWR